MGLQNYKIIFFGTSEFSVLVLEELKKANLLPSLIVTAPDKPKGRGMKMSSPEVKVWGDKNKISSIQTSKLDDGVIEKIKSLKPDLLVVASYGKIIPQDILNIPKHGTLNVHPSLLPKLRGASPIKSLILNDDKDSVGVTIMLMDEKMDHGPILEQKIISLEKWPPKSSDLENLLSKEGGSLLAKIIPDWIDGNIDPQEQNHSEATFTKKIEKSDAEIDLKNDPYKNFLKIQAFDKNPRAYFFQDGKRFIITEAEYIDNELKIIRVIPEGKKEVSYEDYLRSST